MLKIKNIRKLFALIGAGISITSLSGCKNIENENSDTNEMSSISITSNIEPSEEDSIIEESITEEEIEKKLKSINEYECYWWPVGSITTEVIDNVEYALEEPIKSTVAGNNQNIYCGIESGIVNIISSKSGVVVYPSKSDKVDYMPAGRIGNNDGHPEGNCVIIKHVDGNYTVYSHLAADSITTFRGDIVKQGEVIGKMGMSGNISGTGLGFEIRIGKNEESTNSNILDYVNDNNPHPLYVLDEGYYLELNYNSEWELWYYDELVRTIQSKGLTNFLNSLSEITNIDTFDSEDLIKYKIFSNVLNDKDIIYTDRPKTKTR